MGCSRKSYYDDLDEQEFIRHKAQSEILLASLTAGDVRNLYDGMKQQLAHIEKNANGNRHLFSIIDMLSANIEKLNYTKVSLIEEN